MDFHPSKFDSLTQKIPLTVSHSVERDLRSLHVYGPVATCARALSRVTVFPSSKTALQGRSAGQL